MTGKDRTEQSRRNAPTISARAVARIGFGQLLAYASTYYTPAVLAGPIGAELGLSATHTFAGLTFALVLSGVLGPAAGRLVDRQGGRGALIAGALLFALGLTAMACATKPIHLALAWAVIGLGMSVGYYETAFAALARLSGTRAHRQIIGVALIGGLASTVSWPLTAAIESHGGWRLALAFWAAANVIVAAPLYFYMPKAGRPAAIGTGGRENEGQAPLAPKHERRLMIALVALFTATGCVASGVTTNLLGVLIAIGAVPGAAIFSATVMGPAQTLGRLAEFLWSKRAHPLTSTMLALLLLPIGAALLWLGGPAWAPVFACLFGVGNGLLTISRAALPLAIFGARGFGHRSGVLATPARFSGALAPLAGRYLIEQAPPGIILAIAVGLNLFGVGVLFFIRRDFTDLANADARGG